MLRMICFAAVCVALLAATPALAQPPVVDVSLDHFAVAPAGEGAVNVHAEAGIAVCGEARSYRTSLRLIRDGVVLAERPIEVATDIGGTCANTQNGSCAGVACPDAVVNGKTRKGTCMKGSGGYCVCDYGVVGASFNVAVAEGSLLQLVIDGSQAVQEISEANNYGAVRVTRGDGEPGSDVYRLDDPVSLESLRKSGLVPASSSDGVAFTDGFIEQTGGVKTVVLNGVDANGNCRTWGAELFPDGTLASTSHSCTGNPCSSCAFVKNQHHQITGCTCVTPATGTCNHTITSGFTPL